MVEPRTNPGPAERPGRRTKEWVALAGVAALLALGFLAPAPARAQGFTVPGELAGHAILSCRELTLSGAAVVTSEGLRTGAAEGEQGHVRSNRGVVLDGGVEVHGDATPGPGGAVTFNGRPSLVTGSTAPAAEPFDCAPVDLAALRSQLEAANDNATLPRTAKGRPALGGADRRALVLSGRDSLALPSGSYLLSEIRLTGNSRVTVEGPVRILVTGSIDVQGGSHVNEGGSPFDLRLWSAGDSVSVASQALVHGFLYAPAADVRVAGRSLWAGGVQGDRVDVSGGAGVRRVVDDAPPELEVTSPQDGDLVERCEIPVTGRATDGEGSVGVTVNGAPATVAGDGAFTGTASLWTDDPELVAVEAVDRAGNATVAEVRVSIVPPEAVLLSPVPGSVVGQRVVDLVGRSGTATEVTVNGLAAEVPGDGTFRLPGFELGGDGTILVTLVARNCGGATSAAVPLRVDTLPPVVTVDAPPSGACLPAGEPVELGGAFADANPATGSDGQPPPVRVEVRSSSGGEASLAGTLFDLGARWRAAGVDLGAVDGTATATAIATDVLGRTSRAAASWRVDATAPSVLLTLDGGPFPGQAPGAAPASGAAPVLLGHAVAAGVRVDDGGASAPPAAVLTLDGAPYVAGTPITAEGEHLLVATATDCAGHATTVHAAFRLDLTPPALVSTDPAAGARVAVEVPAFSGVANEPLARATVAGRLAAVDGDTFLLTPFPWQEGANRVAVDLVDLAGNRSAHEVAFEVRTAALTVDILEGGAPLADGTVFLRPARPEVRASDSRATVAASLDGTPFASGTEVATAGLHHLSATATDDWGRTATAAVSFTVDLGAGPEVAITGPADGAVLPGPTVRVTGTVAGEAVGVTVNGVTAALAGGTWSVDALPLEPNDLNVLEAVARDAAGRTATAAVTVQVVSGGPQVLILDPPDGVLTPRDRIDVAGVVVGGRRSVAGGTVTVTGVESGATVTAPVEADGTFRAVDVALAAGANTLRAEARDPQDRPGADQVSVVADFAAPTVAFLAEGAPLAEGATFSRPIELAVEVTDDAGAPPAPVVRLNGVDRPEAATPTTAIAVAEEGGYVVAVVAADAAGNETRAERSFLVDFGGCLLAGVHPPEDSAVTGTTVTLTGRSGSAAAVAVRVPDGAGSFQEYPAALADGTFLAGDVPLPAVGVNALVLVCTDAAGNERTQDHPVERLPAGDGPAVAITQPADGALLAADTVAVHGTVTAGAVTVNGLAATVTPAPGDDSFVASGVSLVEGPNVLAARAVDAAGRTGSDRVVVERDSQAPRVQVTRPGHRSRVGRPGGAAPTVDVAGLVDLDTEPHLDRVVVSSAVGQVVASVDPATGAFLAVAVPLDPAAGVEAAQKLTATATDSLGHAGTGSVDVYLNPAGGPAIVLDAPEDLAYLGEDAPASLAVSGDAWTAPGAAVSVNGIDLDPSTLAWDAAAPDGRRHVRFTTSITVPAADGAFGVIARATELDGTWAEDRRLLFRDSEPPRVVEMVPAHGTEGVSPDSLALVLFSEPVLHASLAAADGLTLARSATGQTVVGTRTVAGQAVAFAPGAALAAGEAYRFRAGPGITDRAGNPLAAPEEVAFTVAGATAAEAPVLDPLPAVVCADEITVQGSAAPGATVEVRDGDLAFRGFADASGRFAVTVPAAGSGYHLLRVRALDPSSGAASPEATAVVRVDCSAPRVVEARFERETARIAIVFSEAVDPATLAVGDAAAAIRLIDAEAPGAYQDAALSLPSGSTVELALDPASDAWWRDRPVRLQVGPPAADLEGNPMAAVFETVFFPGAGEGLAGGFLFGEAYDDTTGRPLSGAAVRLFPAGAALPGTVLPGAEGAPAASAATDGRGRFLFAGDVASGRYVLVLEAGGHVPVYRRLSLAPARGAVPFDSRLTPRAEPAGSVEPAAGGSVSAGELAFEADPGALGGSDPLAVRLTPLSGQGLPDFLPLGWTPAAAAEVRLEAGGVPVLPDDAGWLPGGVRLDLPLPAWVAAEDELVAAHHEASGGRWISLPAPERLPDGRARVVLVGPGAVAVVVPDVDPATRPPSVPAVEGEVLVGVEAPAASPDLEADLSLDPPVVPPTGRSLARVVARSADGVTPWPSGLPVQAYLEEKLILAAGAGQLLEAPFSADLVLYHPRLSEAEAAGALPGAAGAVEFVVSPSSRAAQVLLDVGFENVRLFPFPEDVEREPVVGPPGGTIETPEGVELTVPEGALAVRVPVAAELLDAAALAGLPEVAGFDTLAAVRIDLQGHTLGRAATLSLPAPAGTAAATPGDPRLVLAERVDAPADGRGSFPRLAARASLQGSGDGSRIVASPEQAGALPLDGIVREGLYLVLQAQAPVGFVTGFVSAANGAALEAARVSANGLGTADVTRAGGRYAVPVPAGAGSTVRALHPTLEETGAASIPSLYPGQVVSLDLTVVAVPPRVLSVAPAGGAADQPVGTEVSVLFTEPLSGGTVTSSTLTLELADADGAPTGLRVDGTVALAADGTRVVFTPARPLLPGRTFLARFTGGVADAGGTFYDGEPLAWAFSTSTVFVPGGRVHPERFHVRVPVAGVAEIHGEPGAVPGVPLGETPWVVTPEIEGPVADPVRETFQVRADGSFSGTVGRPPDFAATIESRIWVKVFDPSGALAAEFRVSPFTTPDGLGFVAPAGEAVSFRSAEGIEVDVPAGAFDRATLVRVRRLDPATLGVPTPAGLQLGAYVDLDFEGEAQKTLRLAVPAPADAPAGAQAFVGRAVSLPWGRRLQVLTVGGVEMRSDGPYLSNHPSLQPPILQPASGAAVSARLGGSEHNLTAKELPENFRRSLLMEFTLRGGAAWFYEWGASWTMMAGLVQPFGLAQGIAHEAIYNKIADLWVYLPEPRDWGGGFVLPVLSDEPLEIVRRDTATGWILAEQPYDPLPAGTDLVDVGFLPGGTPAPPLLIGARPFRLMRFQAPGPDETQALALEIEARGSAAGQVEVAGRAGFGLAAGTRLALFDLTPALRLDPEPDPDAEAEPPVAGPAASVCDPDAPWALPPMAGGEEMLLVVGPGDLAAASAGVFELQFDRQLVDLTGRPVGEVARLVDLGPRSDSEGSCSASGGAGYPRELPLLLEQEEQRSRLVLSATSALAAGHRFRLELEPGALVAQGEAALSYWPTAPHRFEFATRAVPGDPVAGLPSGAPSLGETDVARDLVKLGNLLLVASQNGDLVAIDASDTTDPEGLRHHSILNSASSFIRSLATDGHGRVFYTGQFGPLWGLKALRLEDAREASADCGGRSDWAAGIPCFDGVEGSVRLAYVLGYTSGMTASEWLAAGSMPTGTPSDLAVLTQDEKGRELPLAELLEAYGAGDLASLAPDTEGVYTFDLALSSTVARGGTEPSLPPGTEPAPPVAEWRERVCEDEEPYDRYQRATVDNLTTGQSWSIDLENPWPNASGGGGDGTGLVQGVRARRGDRLQVRYNLRALGHVSILGSGITVVDLNRFYGLLQTFQVAGGGQCGRRLGSYEGQEIEWPACAPASIGLSGGLSTIPAVETLGATGCDGGPCRGEGTVDVFAPMMGIGGLHAFSAATTPGRLGPQAELAACIRSVAGTGTVLRDMAVAPDVSWVYRGVHGQIDGTFQPPPDGLEPRRVTGDLLALSLGRAGIFVFDVGGRSLVNAERGPALVGHLRVPGHSAFRLQVDPARQLLFAGGTDAATGEPVIDVWDLASVNGAPGLDLRPVPVATLNAGWSTNHIGIDAAGTGLVYTWDAKRGGPRVVPFESPRFSFSGLYRAGEAEGAEAVEPVARATGRFVPLGAPLRASEVGQVPSPADARDDERDATGAFKLRIALPGSLGPELTAKVQSLRALPTERHLGAEDVGASVLPPGGPGWPDNEVVVRLRRLGAGTDEASGVPLTGEAGPLGVGYHLYESVETVLLVADPRARRDYRRQDSGGTEADEAGQCRRCEWPAYLPDPTSDDPALDDVEELLAGPYVRAFLFADEAAGATVAERTRDAVAWFEARAENYPLPYGWAEVAAGAAGVPSPLQVSLTEPAANPATWDAGEAGVAAALTGGELLLSAADHAVAGRSIPFVFERSYRSGTLGYGPLGAAGWWSPLFARIREPPSGEAEYHDGMGHVWRFPPATLETVPEGYEEDTSSTSYLVPEGLYVRLQKLPGGLGWMLVSRQHGTARFDGAGRLTEVADRHHRGGTAGERGSRLRFGYDAFGQLVSVVDDLGRRYRLEYHDDPRPVAAGGDGKRYGLLRKLTDFVDREVEYRWDTDRRLTEVRLPEVENPTPAYGELSYTGSARPTLEYAYDPADGVSASETATGALLHGAYAKLRLASYELPAFLEDGGSEPRARFAYEPATGRLAAVSFPGETGPITWSLDLAAGSGAGPAERVDVTAPWGHRMEHVLTDGRLTTFREALEVQRPGEAGTEVTLETVFTYTGDGRLLETLRPDGSRESLCYADGEAGAGCPGGGAEGSSDRLAEANVVARAVAATTQESQGTADYTVVVSAATYQEDNLPAAVTDGLGRRIDLAVPEAARQDSAAFEAEGVSARFSYDAYGRPERSEGGGEAGPVARLEYGEDAAGRAGAGLLSRIERGDGDAVASWQEIAYDAAFNVEEVRSSFGEAKRFVHDAWDRPVREVHGLSEGGPLAPVGAGACDEAAGAVVERGFDAAGHVVRERRLQDFVDGPSGATGCRWVETRYRYNAREQLVALERSHLADPAQPGAVTAAPREVLVLTYDEHGRLASERRAAASRPDLVTGYCYDAAGRVAGTTTGAEGERRVGYDERSRVVSQTDGELGTWEGRFDAWSRLYHQELPTGAVTRTRFDRAHQPVEEQTFSADPLTSPAAELLAHARMHVTSFGAVERVVKELTAPTSGDAERRVTEQVFDESGRVTIVWRGPEGEPGRVDPARARRELEAVYEPASGRVLAERFGGGFGEDPLVEKRHQYATGAPVPWPVETVAFEAIPGQAELARTFSTAFSRDVFGRVLSQARSDGETSSFAYDRGSQALLAVRTGAGAETAYARDGRGLPVQVTRPNGRGHTRYAYDLDGLPLVERTATADGVTLWQTTTTYDATGRPIARDFADGTREERTYNPDSTVATVTTRDGITLTHAYDPANRIETISPSPPAGGGTTLVDAGDAYAWDPLSRPTRIDRGRPGAAGLDPALAVAYPSYDLASRPAAEVVGERDPLAWTWDVFSRPTEVRLPSGSGHGASGTFEGFTRSFDTLDRLASASGLGAAGLSATPLGADWAWGGGSRLYAMTTRGALGTGVRYGYHGGAGPQVPGGAPDAASEWKLGRMSWGAAGATGPTAAPAVSWGSFGFGWRGHEGSPSDGAKIGREVLGAASEAGALAGLGWTWGYDTGVRLTEAVSGAGDLAGVAPAGADATDRFTFAYGTGDELLERVRESTGDVDAFTAGDYGRIASRDGAPFAYDPVGRRLEDDRFTHRWDWRGQLVEVEVKTAWPDADGDGEPDASPYAGHRVAYDYDARGRMLRRLHEGAADGAGTRPFVEERRFVWEEDRLAAEAAYGPSETGENLRWRKTYIPGPTGLDDAPQVVVEILQPGSPFSGQASTYTCLTDEMGTVVGLVAEDEGADPANPPVPIRYRYTPYGEAHAEIGPELLRALYDAEMLALAISTGTLTQTVADELTAAAGGIILRWSIPLDPATLEAGVVVEELVPGTGWIPVPPEELAIGHRPSEGPGTADDPTELRILLTEGWERERSYRIRLTPALQDRLGRSLGQAETLQWSIPGAEPEQPIPPVQYDQSFPTTYESYQAASTTAGARFPGGQNRLFQGLWTDPVTGMSYARARWYDARNATWLSEDPLFDIDSPNLYAFVAWQPSMATDPLGLCGGLSCRELLGAIGDAFRDTGKDVVDFFTGPFRDTGEAAEDAAASARRMDRTLRSNMGNRDPVIDALLAEDYENLDLPARLHQQELRELGESARAIGETAGHAGRTAGHALNAADRYLLGTGLYKIAVVGGRRVVVSKSLDEVLEEGPPRRRALPPPSRVPNTAGRIVSFVTQEDRVFYRVFSGDKTVGGFLTSVRPRSSAFAQQALDLPAGNTAEFVQEVLVPAGTRLQRSRVRRGSFGGRGGAEQFELLTRIPPENFGPGVPLP